MHFPTGAWLADDFTANMRINLLAATLPGITGIAATLFFGWGMAALRYITINRAKGRKVIAQIIEQAEDRFAHGLWVTIFPEGTRKSPGDAPDYKAGGAILASKTERPVVPVVHNSGEFWPRHSLLKWPGTVTFRIGPAVVSKGHSASEILEEAKNYIEGEYASMHQPNRFPY
ncbi:MAG: lysophospholipid acyltransferase family protein [Granulosicoccaceae bacterium]